MNNVLRIYRLAKDELEKLRDEAFPRGCIVKVEGNYGIATFSLDCPTDKVPVIFENGNTWWKDIEKVTRVDDVKSLPAWVRRMKLALWFGQKWHRE